MIFLILTVVGIVAFGSSAFSVVSHQPQLLARKKWKHHRFRSSSSMTSAGQKLLDRRALDNRGLPINVRSTFQKGFLPASSSTKIAVIGGGPIEPDDELLWRVVLYKDDEQQHTYNYIIRSLCKVMNKTMNRKKAFEICVDMQTNGKATATKTTSKEQAEQICLGLQRQGLTVNVISNKDIEDDPSS